MRLVISTLFSILISSTLYGGTIAQCLSLLQTSNEAQKYQLFNECAENMCAQLTDEKAYFQCVNQNKILENSQGKTIADSELGSFVSKVVSTYQCESGCQVGEACLPSDYIDVLNEEHSDFLDTLRALYPTNIMAKRAQETCSKDTDCASLKCSNNKCAPKLFCRKAGIGEVASGGLHCAEGLTPNAQGKCFPASYYKNREFQLITQLLNQNTDPCYNGATSQPQFQKLFYELNLSMRAFEYLFSNHNTEHGSFNSLTEKLKLVAKEMSEKRSQIVVNFDNNLKEFREDYQTLSSLKPDSEKEVIFKGKTYKEKDLYASKAANNLQMDLLKELEQVRLKYNQEMATLYEDIFIRFQAVRDEYVEAGSDNKNWKYRLSVKDSKKYNFLKKYNEGSIEKFLEIQGHSNLLADKKLYLFDFPDNSLKKYAPTLLTPITKRKRFREAIRSPFLFSTVFLSPIIPMIYRDSIIKKAKGINIKDDGYTMPLKEIEYDGLVHASFEKIKFEEKYENSLFDPDLKIYSGCVNGLIPEEDSLNRCSKHEQTLKDLKARMLASLVYFSGHSRKKNPKSYFGGELVDKDKWSYPDLKKYKMNGARGDYYNYIYEALYNLKNTYKILGNKTDSRIACLNEHKYDGTSARQFNIINKEVFAFKPKTRSIGDLSTSRSHPAEASSSVRGQGTGGNSSVRGSNDNTAGYADNKSNGQSPNININNSSKNESDKVKEATGNTQKISAHSVNPTQFQRPRSSSNQSKDDSIFPIFGQSSSQDSSGRNLSSLNLQEQRHILKNLNKFKATARSRSTIFEDISNSYVDKAYPMIFSE